MKTIRINKDGVAIIWLAIWQDSMKIGPMGQPAPSVAISGGPRFRSFNKLMSAIEKRFKNGEPPLEGDSWCLKFEDESEPFDWHLGSEEYELVKQFWDSLVRNRLQLNKHNRAVMGAVDEALEGAKDYEPDAD